ncbi:MAG: dTMP kinase [Nitrospirae bacterium]|nr:dTMP kinase [Nitrospirota bacterium]
MGHCADVGCHIRRKSRLYSREISGRPADPFAAYSAGSYPLPAAPYPFLRHGLKNHRRGSKNIPAAYTIERGPGVKGIFISLEGIEGTGKSTQARLLTEYLQQRGRIIVCTAEPGGTAISLKIRELLLSLDSREMDPVTELLLYNAARVQHIREVIAPALERGEVVISDRFSDSTLAYQGYGRAIDRRMIEALDAIATKGMRPDLTLLLDIDVETGLQRNREINKRDRLELEDVAFHKKVRAGFLEMAAGQPDRIRIIDCSGSIESIHKNITETVDAFLDQHPI